MPVPPASERADAELREMTEKFEALYSIGPQEEPRSQRARDEDAFFDLPDELDARPTETGAATREPSVAGHLSGDGTTVENAVAMLRTAEAKDRATGKELDRRSIQSAADWNEPVVLGSNTTSRSWRRDMPYPREPLASAGRGSASRRTMRRKVVAAATIALIIGTGIGYLVGKSPGFGASAYNSETFPRGETRLKLEYSLQKYRQ